MVTRESRVLADSSGRPAWGASYTVMACPVGAQVASASTGTTITVRIGHGFSAGQKLIVNIDATKYRTVSSTTPTTVVVSEAVTVAQGDFLVNLGADTGTTTPNYNGSTVTVYTDMGGGTAAVNSVVSASSRGLYRYWHKGTAGIWELVRSSSATPYAVVPDAFQFAPGPLDARSYGATGDGVTDDKAAIQAAIDAAEALAQTDATPAHVFQSREIRLPAGDYRISAPLTLEDSGIVLSGDGSGATRIIPYNGTDGIQVSGGASYLRHVGLRGISIDYSGLTVSNNTHGIKISKATDTCFMEDVQVVFPQTNTSTGLRGISITDSEQWSLRDVWIGWLRGTDSVGVYFDNAGLNRGNCVFDNVVVRDAYIGLKLVGSNITNGLVFNSFKHVNSSAGADVAPLYGVWIAGLTYGVTFNDPHIEAEVGGAFPFTAGFFLDASGGVAIRGVQINNPILSGGMTRGIDLGSAGGSVQHVQIRNVRFVGNDPITAAFYLGASAKDNQIVGATRGTGVTITSWLTDNAGFGGFNEFEWNASAGSGADWKPRVYTGASRFEAADFTVAALLKGTTAASNRSAVMRFEDNQASPQKIDVRKESTSLDFVNNAGSLVFFRVNEAGFVEIPDGITAPGTGTGARFYIDTADGDLKVKYADGTVRRIVADGADGTTLTIAAGVITATGDYHLIDTEGAAGTDDLDTINGGYTGQRLIIQAVNSARTVSVTEAGNVKLASAPRDLDNLEDTLLLVYNGSFWCEVSFSNNGA